MARSGRLVGRGLMPRIIRWVAVLVIASTGGWLAPFAPTPAEAQASNDNTFTFRNSNLFGSIDMAQGYTPSGASTSCPAALGSSWTCTWSSDTFAAGQSMAAGSANVNLYVENNLASPAFRDQVSTNVNLASIALTIPNTFVAGDVMIAVIAIRPNYSGGTPTNTTITPATANTWTLQKDLLDDWYIRAAVYTRVATSSDVTGATSYTWNFTGKSRATAAIMAFSGVDTTTPIDLDAYTNEGNTFSASHATPSIFTRLANSMIFTTYVMTATSTCAYQLATPGMTAQPYTVVNGSAGTFICQGGDYGLQAAAGATGAKTSSTGAVTGAGIAYIAALRPKTGTLTVQLLQNTTVIGSSTTVSVGPGTALVSPTLSTSAVAFGPGDRLNVKVFPTNSTNLSARVWFDGSTQKSRLVTQTIGSATAGPQWSYATTAATMAAPSLDPWSNVVVSGSNDNNLYSASDSTGALTFTPFATGGPIQSRPAMLPASYRTPATAVNIAYVTSQDGYVYAVDTSTGQQVWQSPKLGVAGAMLQGGANVWIQALGQQLGLGQKTFCTSASAYIDVVFVGTSSTSDHTTNKVYALNGSTTQYNTVVTGNCPGQHVPPGGILWTFAPGNMDIISSVPWVDYANSAVWVTSRSNGALAQPVVWKLNAANGTLLASWTLASLGDSDTSASAGIDSSPFPNSDGTWILVGTNGTSTATLSAIASNTVTNNSGVVTHTIGSTTPAPCNCTGTGAIKGLPWPLWYDATNPAKGGETIVFTRDDTVHSVNFNGSTSTFTTPNWTTKLTAPPAVSLVPGQDVFIQHTSVKGTTLTATLANNVTAGNALIATISSGGGAALDSTTPITGGGVTWSLAVGPVQISTAQKLWIYYGTSAVGGTKTVTVTGASDWWALEVSEWSGLAKFGTLDITGSLTGVGTTANSGSVATTIAKDLLIALGSDFNGSTANNPQNGFTALQSPGGGTSHQVHNPAYKIVSATGTYNTTWAISPSTNWGGVIAAFAAAGTPTGSAPVDDGAGHLYVGASDGKVHQLDAVTGTDQNQAPAIGIPGKMGDPTFNVDTNAIHVGGSDGHIYTLTTPF